MHHCEHQFHGVYAGLVLPAPWLLTVSSRSWFCPILAFLGKVVMILWDSFLKRLNRVLP